jgi:pyridoxine/pyridoxamine 5'-phosphate oxidase
MSEFDKLEGDAQKFAREHREQAKKGEEGDRGQEATSQDTQKVASLIRGAKLAMLTTTAPDGTLTSRPMGLQGTDFDGTLWFFTEHNSRKVAHIAAHPQVNVTISAPVSATWVSLTGTGMEVDDPPGSGAVERRRRSLVPSWSR